MARQRKDGLKYFSFDTDFFFSDRRIRALRTRFGNDGISFLIWLWAETYRENGYFLRWDEDIEDNAIVDLDITEGFIEQVLTFLVGRSLLQRSILTNSDTIYTSPAIQKRFQEATKGRKRDFVVDGEIWLLSEEDTASHIKVTNKINNSEKNEENSEKKENNSMKNDTKKKKGNKKKLNETKVKCVEEHTQPEPAHTPLKDEDYKSLCEKYGQSLVDIYIERTSNYKCCNAHTIEKWINEDLENEKSRKQHFKEMKAKKNQFNNFPQRDYSKDDMDELEKKLLQRSYGKIE